MLRLATAAQNGATNAVDDLAAVGAAEIAAVKPGAVATQTAAILVVYYHPQGVENTLRQLCSVLPQVVLVDNREHAHADLAALAQTLNCGYLHGANQGGLAGAYNSALSLLRQRWPDAEQVVFLDEDSDATGLPAFLADSDTGAALAQPNTAAVSPAYRDRATGLRGRYMWLRRFRLGFNPREFTGLRDVAFLINSMSVWRLAAIEQVGAFNQNLAVDHVDTEYCLRARQRGLHLYVNGSFEFPHSIGKRKKYKFFGMEVQAGGHSPQRRYMIGRNTTWLARSWAFREPAFATLCLARLGYEAVGIVLAEPQAGSKLWALCRGVATGLLTRMDRA